MQHLDGSHNMRQTNQANQLAIFKASHKSAGFISKVLPLFRIRLPRRVLALSLPLQLMHFPPGPSEACATGQPHINVLKMNTTSLGLNPDISSLTFLWKVRAEEYWSCITLEQNKPLATVAKNLGSESKRRCVRSDFRWGWSAGEETVCLHKHERWEKLKVSTNRLNRPKPTRWSVA